MLQKVLTGLNEDSSEFTIDLFEQLNDYVAASFIEADVVKSTVYADAGGLLHVLVSLGGPGVADKRAELEKDDTLDDKGQPKTEKAEGDKTSKEKLAAAFAESAKKEAADKAALADAKRGPTPAPPPPPTVSRSMLTPAGAAHATMPATEAEEVPAKESSKEAPAAVKPASGKPLHSGPPPRR